MSENGIVNKSFQKRCFGVPLIKPNILSEPEAEHKVEYTKDSLDNSMSKMDSPLEDISIDNDKSYITPTSYETKSLKPVDIQKISLMEHAMNENEAKDNFVKRQPNNLLTPFIRWSMSERENVKNEVGNIPVAEMGEELRTRWAALSSDTKQSYQDGYEDEREIYEKAENVNDVSLVADSMKTKLPKKTEQRHKRKLATSEKSKINKVKKVKDPSAPKRPSSAYLLWSKERRENINDEMGNLSMADMGRELGKRWKSESPEVKSFYENIYKDKKETYLRELAEYKTLEHDNSKQDDDSMDSEDNLDCSNAVSAEKERIYKNALRPKKKKYFDDCGENRFSGSDMVKPYFKFVLENWRKSAKMTEEVIPDAGPLDVMDCLNQMWGEHEVIVEKYTKHSSKKRIKPSPCEAGPSEEVISTPVSS